MAAHIKESIPGTPQAPQGTQPGHTLPRTKRFASQTTQDSIPKQKRNSASPRASNGYPGFVFWNEALAGCDSGVGLSAESNASTVRHTGSFTRPPEHERSDFPVSYSEPIVRKPIVYRSPAPNPAKSRGATLVVLALLIAVAGYSIWCMRLGLGVGVSFPVSHDVGGAAGAGGEGGSGGGP